MNLEYPYPIFLMYAQIWCGKSYSQALSIKNPTMGYQSVT